MRKSATTSHDKPTLQIAIDKRLPTRRRALHRLTIAQNPEFSYFSRKPSANAQCFAARRR
jgi:hypothetical protein